MPRVVFTANLARQTSAPECEVAGDTVAAALQAVFADHPSLRSYLLDDQGGVRRHVAIFTDGQPLLDRQHLTDPLRPDSEVFILQALSGG